MLTALAAPLEIDLDGDGKKEVCRYDASSNMVFIGKHKLECGGDPCDLEAHDISSADKAKQVEVCAHGPRDDESCTLHTIAGGKLVTYTYPGEWPPPELRTSGNGLVLAVDDYRHRLYTRIEKHRVEGTKLVEVAQPIYTAEHPKSLKVEKTFPLLYAPDSKAVVANTRPDSTIHVLGEHGEKDGWMLVRLSSGISGYVHWETLGKVSEEYGMILGAG